MRHLLWDLEGIFLQHDTDPQKCHLWNLSPSFRRTHLAAPPSFSTSLWQTRTSAAEIRAHPHHTFVRLLGKYTAGAGDRAGYVLRFPKNGFTTASSRVWLIPHSRVNTLSSSPERVLDFGEGVDWCVESADPNLDVYCWLFFWIPRPNDWAQVLPETWLPRREDLRLKFEGCRGASGCPSPTARWICN